MDLSDRKVNSRSHSITMNRDSKFILRKIIMDFAILFCNNDMSIEKFKDLTDAYLRELCPHMTLKTHIHELLDSIAETGTTDTNLDLTRNASTTSNLEDQNSSLPCLSDISNFLEGFNRLPLPEFDIKTLLQTSGNSVLNYYNRFRVLNAKKRNILVDIVIKHVYTYIVNNKLTPEDYNLIAAKIVTLFPSENIASYYMKAISTSESTSEKYIPAKGKLVDKVRNIFYVSGVRHRRRQSSGNQEEEESSAKLVGFLILAFWLWGTPYKRGFFCDDESLKHPYKESTVTSLMLYIVGLGLPVLTMCLTEWIRLRDYKSGRPRELLGKEVPAWVWEAYRVVGVFLFGCACQQLATDIAKYSIGRLRPHFFDVCRPNINCTAPENKWRYIVDFECLRTDEPKLIKEMRLSFPSGHSSFSAYTMLYFAFYLHKRFSWRGSKLLRHSIQFVLVMLAWYTVMTRVSDYKHHWSDVLAGFSIGMLFAIVVFTFISDLRKSPRNRQLVTHHNSELQTNGNGRSNAGWRV